MQMNLTLLEGMKQVRQMDKHSSWVEEQKEDNAMILKSCYLKEVYTYHCFS